MKTHNLLITIIAACFILAGTSVKAQKASGNVVTRDITVADFSGINLSEPIDYLITQGDKNLLIIETDDNLFDQVKADVSNGILSIDTHSLGGASRLKVTIQVKELKNLNISGASNVKTTNTITSPELKIKASGAAEATLDLNVPQLTSELSGASNITLNGNATNHTLKASGASDLKADNLQTSTTNVTLSGACTVKIDVKDKLAGTTSGISNLTYKNKPTVDELEHSEHLRIDDIDSLVEKNIILNDSSTQMRNWDSDKYKSDGDEPGHGNMFGRGKGNFMFGKKGKINMHWVGVNIGINGYLDANGKFATPVGYDFMAPDYAKSWFIDLNFLQFGIPIIKNYWHIVSGAGFQICNYVISKNQIIKPNTNYLEAVLDTSVSYKKNKLTDVYFQVPLLFQFDTKRIHKNNTFHLLMGVVGAVKVTAYTKQKYEADDIKNIRRTTDDFNLAPFRWDAMVKIGYGPVNVFATYQLNQMFQPNHGPELHPFTIGITLLGL